MATAALRDSQTFKEEPKKRFWTFDELLAEVGETHQPMEIWDGELIMTPMPTPTHQTIVLRFARLLQDFVEAQAATAASLRCN